MLLNSKAGTWSQDSEPNSEAHTVFRQVGNLTFILQSLCHRSSGLTRCDSMSSLDKRLFSFFHHTNHSRIFGVSFSLSFLLFSLLPFLDVLRFEPRVSGTPWQEVYHPAAPPGCLYLLLWAIRHQCYDFHCGLRIGEVQ